MSESAHGQTGCDRVRADLVARLRLRRDEIVDAVAAHIIAVVPDPAGDTNPDFVRGSREAVAAAVDYGLVSIEQGQEWSQAVPLAAVTQARRAADSGVALTTALRRYVAGHQRLSAFVMEEVDRSDLSHEQRATLLAQTSLALSSLLGRLVASVSETFTSEVARKTCPRERRIAELVQCVLAGGAVDRRELGYDLESKHVGVLATGACAREAVQDLAGRLGQQLLLVARSDGTVWGWLGGPRGVALTDLEWLLSDDDGFAGVKVAVGEPAVGVAGFRLTHQQAHAALRIAEGSSKRITRFADVALEALALKDGAMTSSLVEIYLAPLNTWEGGAPTLRDTLKAYFAARCNASAAADRLGVDRRTIRDRVDAIEQRLGFPLYERHAELELALRLEALREGPPSNGLPAAGTSVEPVGLR